jgi:hypothetical protein
MDDVSRSFFSLAFFQHVPEGGSWHARALDPWRSSAPSPTSASLLPAVSDRPSTGGRHKNGSRARQQKRSSENWAYTQKGKGNASMSDHAAECLASTAHVSDTTYAYSHVRRGARRRARSARGARWSSASAAPGRFASIRRQAGKPWRPRAWTRIPAAGGGGLAVRPRCRQAPAWRAQG